MFLPRASADGARRVQETPDGFHGSGPLAIYQTALLVIDPPAAESTLAVELPRPRARRNGAPKTRICIESISQVAGVSSIRTTGQSSANILRVSLILRGESNHKIQLECQAYARAGRSVYANAGIISVAGTRPVLPASPFSSSPPRRADPP